VDKGRKVFRELVYKGTKNFVIWYLQSFLNVIHYRLEVSQRRFGTKFQFLVQGPRLSLEDETYRLSSKVGRFLSTLCKFPKKQDLISPRRFLRLSLHLCLVLQKSHIYWCMKELVLASVFVWSQSKQRTLPYTTLTKFNNRGRECLQRGTDWLLI
jgi:hypothetical protein